MGTDPPWPPAGWRFGRGMPSFDENGRIGETVSHGDDWHSPNQGPKEPSKVDTLLTKPSHHCTMSLRFEELDAIYTTVSHEEAVAIANLGAQCYAAVKERLYAAWEAAHDDTTQVELWRKEGAATMLESLRSRLAAGDAAQARVAALESVTDVELTRRAEELATLRIKEAEMAKREEMLVLKEQLAELQSGVKYYAILEEANTYMKEKLDSLLEENEKLKEATATKSSHELGKIGETTVLEMLTSYVAPLFLDADVFDKTKVKHSGDFHVHVMGRHGKMVRIMIDVKKYKRPIDNSEINKLYTDLDACDIDVGLMLSLDSPICTKSQFQLVKTKGNKMCMFLSFEKIDDEIRKEILCWAIRALVGIVSTQDHSSQDVMITEIQQFLIDMLRLVDKLDSGVKSLKGVYDLLRELKEDILARITSYKTTCGLEVIDAIAESVGVITGSKAAGLCKAKNKNGSNCKSVHVAGGVYCHRHTTKSDVISLVE
jgi:hypothetical protein